MVIYKLWSQPLTSIQEQEPMTRHAAGAQVESLESRQMLSVTLADGFGVAAARGGGKPTPVKPAIRLDLVALHEFGHSLGLAHEETAATSIMDAYYNASYDPSNLFNDVAAQTLRDLYAGPNTGPWKDSAERVQDDDDVVDITYSFVADGTALDNRKSSTAFATFDAIFGAGRWEKVFVDQLNAWSAATGGKIAFHPYDGAQGIEPASNRTLAAGTTGAAQGDARFGDIRIGAHTFDGAGKVLAHTYYPPPNGGTIAGDAHFDNEENWIVPDGALSPVTAPATATLSGGGGGSLFSAQRVGPKDLFA
jgi:hypothetical protein